MSLFHTFLRSEESGRDNGYKYSPLDEEHVPPGLDLDQDHDRTPRNRKKTLAMVLGISVLLLLAAGANCLPTHDARDKPNNNKPNKYDRLNPYPDGRRLTFSPDGSFKIAMFSDLHYAERAGNNVWAEWGVEQDRKSTVVMNTILDIESPNFVVFGGDQITGENTMWENSTAFLDQVFSACEGHNTPFASIYGNHDESYNITHLSSYVYETTRARAAHLSWTQVNWDSSADPKGAFNYYIPVYADDKANTPALLLWFFDSRAGTFNSGYFNITDEPHMTQDWVDPGVEPWVRDTMAKMKDAWGSLPKSLAFVHIPPTQTTKIAENVVANPDEFPGIDSDEPIDPQAQHRAEFWHAPANPDLPFWRALTETIGADEGLVALSSGHDHGNAWCARDDSVGPYTFCFGRHTGYGGYGSWTRGARVFEARLQDTKKQPALESVKSWIRLEDRTSANTTTLVDHGRTVLVNSLDPAPKN